MTGNHLRTRTRHQRIHVVIYGTSYEGRRGDPRINIHMTLGPALQSAHGIVWFNSLDGTDRIETKGRMKNMHF